jgi:hypothetical protein
MLVTITKPKRQHWRLLEFKKFLLLYILHTLETGRWPGKPRLYFNFSAGFQQLLVQRRPWQRVHQIFMHKWSDSCHLYVYIGLRLSCWSRDGLGSMYIKSLYTNGQIFVTCMFTLA